jgi:Cation efflux family
MGESVSARCCHHHSTPETDARNRLILWAALAINLGMFLVEIMAGLTADSVALQADALDFLSDAANFAISLFVIGVTLRVRAMAALAKGGTMALFGVWLVGATLWHAISGTVPEAPVMGAVGVAALIANGTVLGLLTTYRRGDASMRSVWVCIATTPLAMSPSCLRPPVFSAPVMAGRILPWRLSWRRLPCGARRKSSDMPSGRSVRNRDRWQRSRPAKHVIAVSDRNAVPLHPGGSSLLAVPGS